MNALQDFMTGRQQLNRRGRNVNTWISRHWCARRPFLSKWRWPPHTWEVVASKIWEVVNLLKRKRCHRESSRSASVLNFEQTWTRGKHGKLLLLTSHRRSLPSMPATLNSRSSLEYLQMLATIAFLKATSDPPWSAKFSPLVQERTRRASFHFLRSILASLVANSPPHNHQLLVCSLFLQVGDGELVE